MAANAEIYFEHDRWGRNLSWSVGLHIAIAGSILLYAVVAPSSHGDGWGAGGVGWDGAGWDGAGWDGAGWDGAGGDQAGADAGEAEPSP